MNIYVGNISKRTTEESIRKVFELFGQVDGVTFIHDKYTHELRGFGFVEMPAKAEANNAIKKISGKDVDGNKWIVNEAGERRNKFFKKSWFAKTFFSERRIKLVYGHFN